MDHDHVSQRLSALFRCPFLHTIYVVHAILYYGPCIWMARISRIQFLVFMDRYELGEAVAEPSLPILAGLRECRMYAMVAWEWYQTLHFKT